MSIRVCALYGGLAFLLFGNVLPAEENQVRQCADLVKTYLWPKDADAGKKAFSELEKRNWASTTLSKAELTELENIVRKARDYPVAQEPGKTMEIKLIPEAAPLMFVRTPSSYTSEKSWPVIICEGGGPFPSLAPAIVTAKDMFSAYKDLAEKEGFILVGQVYVNVDRFGEKSRNYDGFLDAAMNELATRYNCDYDRIYYTGLSAGSWSSWHHAMAHPDRIAAIGPIACGIGPFEGIRNTINVPLYQVAGAKDYHLGGPVAENTKAVGEVLDKLGHTHKTVILPDAGHDARLLRELPNIVGFFKDHRRNMYPRKIVRVPLEGNSGPQSLRSYWIEVDSENAAIVAEIKDGNTIEVKTTSKNVTLYLSDRLVDLDKPVKVRVNEREVYNGVVKRSMKFAVEHVMETKDPGRIFANKIAIKVKDPLSELTFEPPIGDANDE